MLSFVLCMLLYSTICAEDGLRIHTSSGILLGRKETALGQPLRMFHGVPYAIPPVGELRFKRPVPLKSEGVERDAKYFAPACYQPRHAEDLINPLLKVNEAEINENCLYLNIYVPDNLERNSLPVMVWLPGEGFNYADSSQFDGKYLAILGQVIVVTVNYRVGVFGFLSTLNDDAPGNVGLLDQRAALKWTQTNIENFGGDSNKVTLFGRFTGAISAAIHTFSPLNIKENLFQRVILQSGVPSGEWIFDSNPVNSTLELGKYIGCVNSTTAEILECLKQIPAEDLLKVSLHIPGAWRPTLDTALIEEHSFTAAAKMNYNPVNILIGVNKDEGTICMTALENTKSMHLEKILQNTLSIEDFHSLIRRILSDVYRDINEFVYRMAAFQYEDYDVAALRDNFVKFCGDIYFKSNAGRLADILSSNKRNKVFLYELDHRPSFSIQAAFIKAGHGDDVLYSFGLPLSITSVSAEEAAITRQIVDSFSNFAYHGNPNSENSDKWPVYTTKDRLMRKFGAHLEEDVQKCTFTEAILFWQEIVPFARNSTCPLPVTAPALTDAQAKKQDTQDFQGTSMTEAAVESLSTTTHSTFCSATLDETV